MESQLTQEDARRLTIWDQLAAQPERWIGGTLIDLDDDPNCPPMPEGGHRTTITGIEVRPNGDGLWFGVSGAEFDCGGDTRYLGVSGKSCHGDGLAFRNAFGGHEWHILHPHSEGR